MGSEFADLHQDLADSTSGSLAASIEPQASPKGESVKGRESMMISAEDERPLVHAVSRLEIPKTSVDPFILDSLLQTDVSEVNSLLRAKGSCIQQNKISHLNFPPCGDYSEEWEVNRN
ncbi:hypothetical protein Nepgr_006801 [Nepenthes gracilis]|uniref:Uncharacterized protein n=1 Tax=Nepenthes gracilis TaxID=150966 RepID=A0AAD3S5X9_NEPGR|nr:hypothetical protein Nepgr_006801 [Nepenthes gracilis]